MARFILDVANLLDAEKFMNQLFESDAIRNRIATIHCIDESNNNQFYTMDDEDIENGYTNELSIEQIENFKKVCNGV